MRDKAPPESVMASILQAYTRWRGMCRINRGRKMTMNAVPSGPPESDNKRAPGPGGGGPPHDGGTERRLTALEVRFDTILPTLATKADLGELRLDMEKMRSGLLEKISALGTELRGEISALGTGIRQEMHETGLGLRTEIEKLNKEVHSSLMTAMMWFGGLAITAIFSFAGAFYHLNTQISNLAARLPAASPVAPVPAKPAASATSLAPDATSRLAQPFPEPAEERLVVAAAAPD